ncbi:MAG: sigma-70 family RNA polymerase sigma factor [Chloroflexota bacterium]|nr:sigma-70 family RNA polymerase sigma factor [Chloroflexota bacterium]
MDEAQIIEIAQQGDVEAFNQLVRSHEHLAYNVAYRILGDYDRAMDATQDAFLRAYKALDQFRGGSFKAWLLRITTNCCYDILRAKQRHPSTSIDDLVENAEHSRILEDHTESAENGLMREELGAGIQRGLDTLPYDQRVAVIMVDIQDMRYEEIAQVTLVPLGTVKSRINRGRKKLRDYLLEHRELLPEKFRPRYESGKDG